MAIFGPAAQAPGALSLGAMVFFYGSGDIPTVALEALAP